MNAEALASRWREKAATLRPFAEAAALAFEEAATDLERTLAHVESDTLSPRQAAVASGYSAAHIRRLLDEGTIPNAGTEDHPRVRQCDLPRKPGHGVVAPAVSRPSISRGQAVRAVVNGR